jgi:hypothetical protein
MIETNANELGNRTFDLKYFLRKRFLMIRKFITNGKVINIPLKGELMTVCMGSKTIPNKGEKKLCIPAGWRTSGCEFVALFKW